MYDKSFVGIRKYVTMYYMVICFVLFVKLDVRVDLMEVIRSSVLIDSIIVR